MNNLHCGARGGSRVSRGGWGWGIGFHSTPFNTMHDIVESVGNLAARQLALAPLKSSQSTFNMHLTAQPHQKKNPAKPV